MSVEKLLEQHKKRSEEIALLDKERLSLRKDIAVIVEYATCVDKRQAERVFLSAFAFKVEVPEHLLSELVKSFLGEKRVSLEKVEEEIVKLLS